MSDEAPEAGKPAEDITNLKAEMNRKLSNFDSKFSELQQTNQQLLAQIQQLAVTSTKAPATDDIEDLWLDNPKEAARRIQEETEAKITKKMEAQQQADATKNRVLADIMSKYPELNRPDHELTMRAVEIYNTMDPKDQSDPKSYKLAVTEAAAELGLQPVNKRKKANAAMESDYDDDDSFSTGGSSGSRKPSKRAKDDELDPRTVEFAKYVGLDTNNPKVIENLKKRSQRTKWDKYQ